MTLKKFSCVAIAVCLLSATASLAGCGNESNPDSSLGGDGNKYKPDSSLQYFDSGNYYRVIELKDEEPKRIDSYGLYAFLMPFAARPFQSASFTVDKNDFPSGTLFFKEKDHNLINKNGIEVIADCLNLDLHNLSDRATRCAGTNLFTFTELLPSTTIMGATINTEDRTGLLAAGFVSDVVEYTFSYRDLSKSNGTEVATGEFSVLVSDGLCWVDIFVPFAD